ncbi:hypothetical protein Tco_0916561, partial [Tanacetum coccineum]
MEKALTETNISITSNDITIELSKEFLVKLRKNTYYETYNEDVVEHIAKGEGKITTWKELVEKFFCRFYPESYDREDEIILNNDGWKESKYENPPNTPTDSFFKAYDIRDIEEEIRQGYMKHKNDDSDNKQPRKTKKFKAVKYSLGPNEEYIILRRCEYNTWERDE